MRLCPEWAREWQGQPALIAASGPSQRAEDLEYARGKCRVVVINSTWRLAPWADALYACDAGWWQMYGPGADEFTGRRLIGKPTDTFKDGYFWCYAEKSQGMIWDGEHLGGLDNSGSQAINLLALWGVSPIYLTGFDFNGTAPSNPGVVTHWHGPYGGRSNPRPEQYKKWIAFLTEAAPVLKARGVEVVNCSRDSKISADCFPRARLEDVL